MKKSITLSIPQSCNEIWDEFSKTATGRQCDTCATIVHDFSQMTERN